MNVTEFGKLCCETVQVCPNFEAGATVSPLLFGNNLEHTRSCVHTGISAQMLRNRKFAGSRHAIPAVRKDGIRLERGQISSSTRMRMAIFIRRPEATHVMPTIII